MSTTTRYYFDVNAPTVTPAPDAGWTGTPPRLRLTPALPVLTNPAGVNDNYSTPVALPYVQAIASGLPEGRPLTGSMRAVLRLGTAGGVSGTSQGVANARLRVVLRVVSNDGATVRGTLGTFDSTELLPNTSNICNRTVSGALSSVVAQAGDRLVAEVGVFYNNTTTTGLSSTVTLAPTSNGADLSYVDGLTGETDARRAWVEITLDDPPPPGPPTNLRVTGSTSSTISVAWDPPTTGGTVEGYRVRLQPRDATNTPVGMETAHTFTDLLPNNLYQVVVEAYNAYGFDTAVLDDAVTLPAPFTGRPAPGIASQAVLYAAGLDPRPESIDAPAQQWWDVDRTDAETYNPARSGGLLSYAIGYGARDPLGRGGALTVTVALLVPVWDAVSIGDRFRLRLSATLAQALGLTERAAIRATAIVTDAVADPVRSWDLPGYGPAILWNVTASGWYSRYGAASIDGTSWPIEPVGTRIRRVLDSLGLTGDVDATGANVRPMGGAGSHHQALAAATDSTLGRLVEQRTGLVDYHDPEDRRGTLPILSLDAGEILGENFTWRQSVGDVQNSVEVTYGPTGAKVLVEDRASADPRSGVGPYPAQISTILDQQLDAYDLAADTVGRRAWPFYQLPAVAVDLARSGLDLARVAEAFEVVVGDRVALSSMPPGSPWESTPRGCFVEGYTETATAYAWRLSLVVSDPAMSGVSLRYVDVPDTITYADVAADVSYLDVSRIEDPADLL